MSATAPPHRVDASLVDLRALGTWMDRQDLPRGPIEAVERLGGGSQNVLVRFARGGHEYVLRRGPRHLRANSNRVIEREMRVLEALEPTDVPHPRFIAGCHDEAVLGGAVFYLMEPVDGFNPIVELPATAAEEPTWRVAMSLDAVDALARLGALDHEQLGLRDFGRPDGYLERQVPRWLEHLDGYGKHGHERDHLVGVDDIADWLIEHRPRTCKPGILHGDFHLGNLLFSRATPSVAAIVDWEMCTIGDPLIDLGLFLAAWPTPESPGPLSGALGRAGALPSADELLARYAASSTRDLSAVDWYIVLAGFKTGIVAEGTCARAHAGLVSDEIGESVHRIAQDLIDRARSRVQARP